MRDTAVLPSISTDTGRYCMYVHYILRAKMKRSGHPGGARRTLLLLVRSPGTSILSFFRLEQKAATLNLPSRRSSWPGQG